jgi:hypothetical protein
VPLAPGPVLHLPYGADDLLVERLADALHPWPLDVRRSEGREIRLEIGAPSLAAYALRLVADDRDARLPKSVRTSRPRSRTPGSRSSRYWSAARGSESGPPLPTMWRSSNSIFAFCAGSTRR